MKKTIRKTVAVMLVLSIIFSMITSLSSVAFAADTTRVNSENLITNITNPSNGTISFYLNIPAGTTVSYKVELIRNKRAGSVDTISGTVKNSGSSKLSKKITVKTIFFSNQYTITATYTTGTTKNKTIHTDVDNATSTLKTEVKTNKFVWNDANIKKWKTANKVAITLSFGASLTIDILATKGYVSGLLATALSITLFAGDLASANTITDTKTINVTPIKGWGYQYKLTPSDNGFTRYFLIYDGNGKLYQTINLGKVPLTSPFPVIR